jgi:hypothetical protein
MNLQSNLEIVRIQRENLHYLQELEENNNPPIIYFDEYIKRDDDFSLAFKSTQNGKCFAALPARKINNLLVCHPNAFFCEIYGEPELFIQEKEQLYNVLRQNEIRGITFRKPPYSLNNLLDLANGVEESPGDTLSIIDLNNYLISEQRKRHYRKAERFGYEFFQIQSGEKTFEYCWNKMSSFLLQRGLPVLSWQRVHMLCTQLTNHFALWGVQDRAKTLVGLALTQKIGNCLRIPNYFGANEAVGATEFMLMNLMEIARDKGFEYVDLGSSRDPNTGIVMTGIIRFKLSLGARPEEVKLFRIML